MTAATFVRNRSRGGLALARRPVLLAGVGLVVLLVMLVLGIATGTVAVPLGDTIGNSGTGSSA